MTSKKHSNIGATNKLKLAGIKRSDEFKRKVSESSTGRKHTEEEEDVRENAW